MLKRAWAQLRCYPRRLVAVCLAVVLGVGFTAATVAFTATYSASRAVDVGAASLRADVMIPTGQGPAETARTVSAVPGVRHAEPLFDGSVEFSSAKSKGSWSVTVVSTDPGLRWFGVREGHWPAAGEILIDDSAAEQDNLAVGSQVDLTGWNSGGDDARVTVPVVVSGITDTRSSVSGGAGGLFAAPTLLQKLGVTQYGSVAVAAQPDITPEVLRDRVSAALGGDVEVRTGVADAAFKSATVAGRQDMLGVVLLAFAVIALVVSAIVIGNTFTILLTQRRRELALLRCVGASARQLRQEVLLEGAALGVIGSVAGIGIGIGIAAVAAGVTDLDHGGLRINLPMLSAVFAVGVLVTVLSAAWPAAKATSVPPLAALRPASGAITTDELRAAGRLRTVLGVLVTLAGAGALGLGAKSGSLMMALAGGAVSAVGVLLLTRSVLPVVLRVLTPLAGTAGTPGRIAAGNVRRNPGRSAGTSAALLVGVALIVTLQVGAASARATLTDQLADRFPVDVAVTDTTGKPLPGSVIDTVAGTGVEPQTVAGAMATLSVSTPEGATSVLVQAPSAAALAAARGGSALNEDTVLVPPWWTDAGMAIGSRLTLTVGGRSMPFTVAAGHLTDTGGTSTVMVSAAALQQLAPNARTVAVWAMLPENADAGAITSALQVATADQQNVQLTGSAEQRASTDDELSTVLILATGMLAVAVLIAVVGIGNTLGLSVLERTGESALLRALGLQRRQLRGMIAIEALLLAAVGAVVGIALGIGYGIAGAKAAVGEADRAASIAIPWGQISVVLALALVAGLVASVLPARRAAAVQPAAALAEQL